MNGIGWGDRPNNPLSSLQVSPSTELIMSRERVSQLQQEVAVLRSSLRELEGYRDQATAYERDLREIGQRIGCDHIEDGLARCISDYLEGYEDMVMERVLSRKKALRQYMIIHGIVVFLAFITGQFISAWLKG